MNNGALVSDIAADRTYRARVCLERVVWTNAWSDVASDRETFSDIAGELEYIIPRRCFREDIVSFSL